MEMTEYERGYQDGMNHILSKYKRLGRPLGKPGKLKLDNHKKDILRYLDLGLTRTTIAKLCGVTSQTVYNYLKRRGLTNEKKVG
jgi:DNA invertase Pin-like site-specific DNA recombinase